jgi:signal transduction histidine kinase
MRVLVADDDHTVRDLLRTQLGDSGYDVILASDGDEAWTALLKHDLHLAVLDRNMPGVNGPEICRRLHKLGRAVYVIILTADEDARNITAALDAGASDYVVKPWAADVLLARVNVGARTVTMQAQLAQTQKLESIGRLAAGIAHEINTPTQYVGDNTRFLRDAVGSLLQALDLCQEFVGPTQEPCGWDERAARVRDALQALDFEFLREEIPKAVEQSLEGLERVTRIVRAMKDFAHPGAEGKEAVDLNQAIESTITVARNEWKYVAEMVTDFDPALPAVSCVAGEFNQVILNIVVNAAHAIADVVGRSTGEKGTITIATRQDGGWAEIRIADTGTGIPEEHRSKIFDHFFTTKELGKGTGQGLAIAYAVVTEKHGGTITVETEMGKGTTFIIRLPIESQSAPAEETPQHEEAHSLR